MFSGLTSNQQSTLQQTEKGSTNIRSEETVPSGYGNQVFTLL